MVNSLSNFILVLFVLTCIATPVAKAEKKYQKQSLASGFIDNGRKLLDYNRHSILHFDKELTFPGTGDFKFYVQNGVVYPDSNKDAAAHGGAYCAVVLRAPLKKDQTFNTPDEAEITDISYVSSNGPTNLLQNYVYFEFSDKSALKSLSCYSAILDTQIDRAANVARYSKSLTAIDFSDIFGGKVSLENRYFNSAITKSQVDEDAGVKTKASSNPSASIAPSASSKAGAAAKKAQ